MSMFGDSSIHATGFDPVVETESLVSDGHCQTSDVKTVQKETETTETRSIGTQVAPPNSIVEPVPYDTDKLLVFLKRVMPSLEEELKNYGDDDNSYFNSNDESFTNVQFEGHERHSAAFKQLSIQPSYCKEKIISHLSWNSTGVLLALSYCEKKHDGWCSHETFVGVYNTSKEKFENHPPLYLLKVASCVRCIQFHSYVPSLLAGGFYNGDIAIWSLTGDEEVLMTHIKVDGTKDHVDVVTSLNWREDRNGVWLITTGRDGKIIFWKVAVSNLSYETHDKFILFKRDSLSMSNEFNVHLEILSLSFWCDSESEFIVAAGENLFHCSSRTAKSLASLPNYRDPVCMNYQPHKAVVTCVSCAPKSNLFASCGMDKEIHIHKSKLATPLFIIHTTYLLTGIEWTNESNCILSWGGSSKIEHHRINLEKEAHVSATVGEVDCGISTLAINTARRGKLAVGSIKGEVLLLSEVPL